MLWAGRRGVAVLIISLCAAGLGCTDEEPSCPSGQVRGADGLCVPDPDSPDDAGVTLDSGHEPDGGPTEDGGRGGDAGTQEDAGGERDAGGEQDAGCGVPAQELDILFLIDNSGTMYEEQASLAAELPRLLAALGTGGDPDLPIRFEPPSSIHVGVITTDMGTGPTGYCGSEFGDDGVLRTEGNPADPTCAATYPSWLDSAVDPPSTLGASAACVTGGVGTSGCGFEQHLDAMLKALTPSTSGVTFSGSTVGHGDEANAGFLRPDSVLLLIALSDEDDCSAIDPTLFDLDNPALDPNLSLRCFRHPELVHPISRYRDGLLQLRATRPDRLIYAPIVGVPVDLVPSPTDPLAAQLEAVLADSRMQETVHPMDSTQLTPSCQITGRGKAFPPRRMLQVAAELDRGGARGVVGSLCQASFATAIEGIITVTGSALDACR